MRKRQLLIPLGIAAGLAVVPGVAAAAWQVSGTNSATAAVSSVGTGAQPTVTSVATSTVNLRWAPSTVASGVEAGSYTVNYYAAATGGTAQGSQTCSGPSSAGFVNCAITSVAAGTHFFGVTPKYRNWTGLEGLRTSATATASNATAGMIFSNVTVNGTSVTPTCTGTIGSTYSCAVSGGNNDILRANVVFVNSSGTPTAFSTTSTSTIPITYTGKNGTPASLTIAANGTQSTAQARTDKNGSNSGSITATFNGWTAVITIN